jgi:hypothetical protein
MHARRRTDSFRTKLFGQSKRVAGEEVVSSASAGSGALLWVLCMAECQSCAQPRHITTIAHPEALVSWL